MENNFSTDKQLVSIVQNIEWIDLSTGHKKLRTDVEDAIKASCVEKQAVSPIMIKGAFGIGKTAGLKSPIVKLAIDSPAATFALTSPASFIISEPTRPSAISDNRNSISGVIIELMCFNVIELRK